MLFAPSGKGRNRQKKGEKGRFRLISRKGGQTPLKPPFVTPPFAAAHSPRVLVPRSTAESVQERVQISHVLFLVCGAPQGPVL